MVWAISSTVEFKANWATNSSVLPLEGNKRWTFGFGRIYLSVLSSIYVLRSFCQRPLQFLMLYEAAVAEEELN